MKQTVEFDYAVGQHVAIQPIETVGIVTAQIHDMGNKAYRVVYWIEGRRMQTEVLSSELSSVKVREP